jgi:AAA ATPase domain
MISSFPQVPVGAIERARQFAALSGAFDPKDALTVLEDLAADDPTDLVAVASELASACDTALPGDRPTWLMRGPERRWELEALNEHMGIREAVTWRRQTAGAAADTLDLLDALLGEGLFDDQTVQSRIEAGGPRYELERIAVALDRTGRLAPAGGRLDAVRAALTRLDGEERNRALLAGGFVGRDAEMAEIALWLDVPSQPPPIQALFVSGLPGIGKSTLLEGAVQAARESSRRWLVVRLDFDRAGLDVQDQVGLTVELARQISAELGEHAHALRDARLEASGAPLAETVPAVKGEARSRIPTSLARTLAAEVQAVARPVLLVLDTLEILRGRGETHPRRLFSWIDQLVSFGLAPMSALAAGRGDALDSAPERTGRRIDLPGLDDASADRLLAGLEVPASSFGAIRAIAQGSPLVLRLAATVVRDVGPAALDRVAQRNELAAAYLYRFLLSRIEDRTLRALAHPGLVVRRISAEVIAEVLGPQLGFGRLNARVAAGLFDRLSSQYWLVEPDPTAPGFVKHRTDIRSVLLRLLYSASPARCARIDRAATAWFAARPEPWCAVESAYHRLQLMRRDRRPPAVDPAVLQRFDEETIAELPERAQDIVRQSRGERSSLGRTSTTDQEGRDSPAAVRELEAIIGRGDWIEGQSFYDRTLGRALFDARSRDAEVSRAFLWRTGQWHEAKRLLIERDGLGADDHDVPGLPAQLAAPRLEMRAELSFAALLRSFSADPAQGRHAADVALRGLPGELSGAALGFALQRAGLGLKTTSWGGHDGILAAFATWLPQPGAGEARPALSAARDRLGRRVQSPQTASDADPARLLAVLAPHAELTTTLSRIREDGRIARHATAVDRRLAELGGLPPPGSGSWRLAPEPAEPIDGLAALGLFAEWVGAAAFVLRDPDLALLARSAERWRRTTAGQWSYDRPPAAWKGWDRPLDVTLAARLTALEAATDPAEESLRQLEAWSGGDLPGAPELLPQIRRRLPGALNAARTAIPDGQGAARTLLRHRVPSAFIPPLTVLLMHHKL